MIGSGLVWAAGSRIEVSLPLFANDCSDHSDIIITETGTSSFGLTNVPLPSHSTYVAQILWGAIGWSVGAALGCVLAAKEAKKERRTVLFVGDGSLQLVRSLATLRTMLTADSSRDWNHAAPWHLPVSLRAEQ